MSETHRFYEYRTFLHPVSDAAWLHLYIGHLGTEGWECFSIIVLGEKLHAYFRRWR
jgi:hypothetical protein